MIPSCILIPIAGEEVASRFDLACEILIVRTLSDASRDFRTVVLPQASAEGLCHEILKESVTHLICGAIEEEYFQFLSWKRITLIDNVAGPWNRVLDRHFDGTLSSGDILFPRMLEGRHVTHP